MACFPAALRTPAASYITTRANAAASAKIAVSNPSIKPTPVANAVTKVAWELGIPPVPTSRRKFNLFSFTAKITVLTSWAIAQATTAVIKTELPPIRLSPSMVIASFA